LTATTRRDFLRIATSGVAGAALPACVRDALLVPAHAETKTIRDVEHVVILMLENRSFDHYFGTLRGVRGFGDRFPVPLASGKPVWYQSDGTREITPFRLDMNRMNALKVDSTSHEFADTQAAWNQGKYGYWPKFKIDIVTQQVTGHSMGYYTRQEIPFQFALAEAFTLCDAYHCGVLTGTDPNRIQFFSGSNVEPGRRDRGLAGTVESSEVNNLRCWITGAFPHPGYGYVGNAFDWPTLPELLEAAKVSWRIYQDPNDNWSGGMHGCLAFRSFREAKPGSSIYENGMSHWSLDDFAGHVSDGALPQVSWILPSQAESEHASGSSPASGADFTSRILSALVANPKVWSRTALFVTFDENDGYFDHVPPPAVPSLNADGSPAGATTMDVRGLYFQAPGAGPMLDPVRLRSGAPRERAWTRYLDPRDTTSGLLRPYGMGPRVPMVVVSPWSRGGWVSSEVFTHTSVGQFLERRFGIVVPAISRWHRAVAGDLTSAFDFVTPNDPTFPRLPDTTRHAELEARQLGLPAAVAPPAPSPFGQERGVRPARATPYELHVNAAARADGTLALRFASAGSKGAVFHVYDKKHLERIPRRYTVEAGKSLEDAAWNLALDAGAYDLFVLGPNGFVRTFSGNVRAEGGAELGLELRYDAALGRVLLVLTNAGSSPAEASVLPNAYQHDGPRQVLLKPGDTVESAFDVAASGNWYDFTVTAPGFERRCAGRLENGGNLTSDPAMAT
jgi:phospholipase C